MKAIVLSIAKIASLVMMVYTACYFVGEFVGTETLKLQGLLSARKHEADDYQE